jgi:hypothetical protein
MRLLLLPALPFVLALTAGAAAPSAVPLWTHDTGG